MKKHKRFVLGSVVLGGSMLLGANSAAAAWCAISTGWIATHEQVEKHLIQETQILENDVAKAGSETLEQVLAALKVLNRQTSGEGQGCSRPPRRAKRLTQIP